MIISHKYKFIFLKTSKTGGTSVEMALSKFCGVDDILTRISPMDERARRRLGYQGSQNYLSPLLGSGIKNMAEILLKWQFKPIIFYNHITAKGVRSLVNKQVWNNYYKFCFERNPWDRVISQYHWRNRSKRRPTMSQFVKSNRPLVLKRRGYDIYTINGEVAVDKVCRFENLEEEMETVRKQLGIPEPLSVPQAKSQFRKDKRPYQEILGEVEKRRIEDIFRDEIDLFGYEF